MANLLFKTGFADDGVSLGNYYNFSANSAWQDLQRTDPLTGAVCPASVLGSTFFGMQSIAVNPITPATIGDYVAAEIRRESGPGGESAGELFQQVKIKAPVGQGGSQCPLLIKRPSALGDVQDLYVSYWFKHQADLESQLDNTVSAGNWRAQFEFKTGGYGNDATGDYRITVYVMKGADGKLYWSTKGDNVAGAFPVRVDYWVEDNHTVLVPVDEWFKFEAGWHRSSGSDGRYFAAVNGQVIVDHRGPNMGDYNLPITRIFVSNPYSGGRPGAESRITGLEICDGLASYV